MQTSVCRLTLEEQLVSSARISHEIVHFGDLFVRLSSWYLDLLTWLELAYDGISGWLLVRRPIIFQNQDDFLIPTATINKKFLHVFYIIMCSLEYRLVTVIFYSNLPRLSIGRVEVLL